MAFIEVENVTKTYKLAKREKGVMRNLKALFHREYFYKHAVNNINFSIESGESVGYIGMNGAGKSTTIKMLSGILIPDSGKIEVGGMIPYEKRRENAKQIGIVFGQRSRLNWDLPMTDTFELYRRMYEIGQEEYKKNIRLYTEILGLEEFMDRPVRLLSLGEKMRANLAVALLHNPSVVYLDEPTIGLDIVAKSRIRDLISEINNLKGTTIMLTTHDMMDIEYICNRIIFIHKGEIYFDGSIDAFKETYGLQYKIIVYSSEKIEVNGTGMVLQSVVQERYEFLGDKRVISIEKAFAFLTSQSKAISSIQIEEANIEDIVMSLMRHVE
ncbi:MAG: ATP-binding cassette domain-containing protein [Lachnospiraceae bacterium]|nr:ATP-binding cassette domain-containing protein [Lachnospiraceae bacterium]